MSIPEKIKAIIGCKVIWNNEPIVINDYAINGSNVILIVGDREITISTVKFNEWFTTMDYKNMVSTLPSVIQNNRDEQIKDVALSSHTQINDVKKILMDNIKKVQDNKEYIPQAEAINKQVKSMIDITKSEIEIIKIMKS